MHMDDLEGHFSRPHWYDTGAGTACRSYRILNKLTFTTVPVRML